MLYLQEELKINSYFLHATRLKLPETNAFFFLRSFGMVENRSNWSQGMLIRDLSVSDDITSLFDHLLISASDPLTPVADQSLVVLRPDRRIRHLSEKSSFSSAKFQWVRPSDSGGGTGGAVTLVSHGILQESLLLNPSSNSNTLLDVSWSRFTLSLSKDFPNPIKTRPFSPAFLTTLLSLALHSFFLPSMWLEKAIRIEKCWNSTQLNPC